VARGGVQYGYYIVCNIENSTTEYARTGFSTGLARARSVVLAPPLGTRVRARQHAARRRRRDHTNGEKDKNGPRQRSK